MQAESFKQFQLNQHAVKTSQLTTWSRIMLVVTGLSLLVVLYTPIWKIELNAPQYPEGLSMTIHANDIKGNVDIINGLNHYIGMKTLHKEDFPEFRILPGCIVFFAIVFILTAFVNLRKVFYITFALFLAFGVLAMVDFWKWEYDYGHNLNPHAAIIIPGMAYQPPFIGFKQLLNFGAYSIPDTGGWVFIGCGALLLLAIVLEWRGASKKNRLPLVTPALGMIVFMLSSCKTEPVSLRKGKDVCAFCKMTLEDLRFGGEIVTGTGKIYTFDDVQCVRSFFKDMKPEIQKNTICYLCDFCGDHSLCQADQCVLLHSPNLKCPMNGQIAAFRNEDSLNKTMKLFPGEKTRWKQLQ
jgi:copper chaperone NosL